MMSTNFNRRVGNGAHFSTGFPGAKDRERLVGHSPLEEIAVREKEISGITDRLLSSTPDSIEAQIGEVRRLVEEGIQNLQGLSKLESSAAKEELHSHLSAVRMYPSVDGEGWYYIAEGTWDLLGTDPLAPEMRVCEEGRIRMVAGACNHPNVPSIPFSFTIRPNHPRREDPGPMSS